MIETALSSTVMLAVFAFVDPPAHVFRGNIFCGPRAVQQVLEHYGRQSDLQELIQETQWPATERGASIKSLAEALNARGIHTAAVSIGPGTEIDWDYPVIVHLQHGDQEHYVVWLPPKGPWSPARVWDGAGAVVRDPRRFAALRSGPILLTSDEPISQSAVFAERHTESFGLWSATILMIAALVACLCGYLVPRRKSNISEGTGEK